MAMDKYVLWDLSQRRIMGLFAQSPLLWYNFGDGQLMMQLWPMAAGQFFILAYNISRLDLTVSHRRRLVQIE